MSIGMSLIQFDFCYARCRVTMSSLMSRQRKEHSTARRVVRAVIWTTFGFVLFVLALWSHLDRAGFSDRQRQQRQHPSHFHRPPTVVHAPQSEVPPDLFRIHIEIASNDVQVLRGYLWHGWHGRQQERPQVVVTVHEGGVTYTDVALHLKGAAGSFRPFDDKPALTLNFNKHARGQKFHGYSKISLNNSVQDPTYLCEAISRELFDKAGVPVPRAEHATVIINGRDLGLYVLTEGYNKDFLRRYFRNVKGNLYDGGFCQEVNPNLSVNSGDNPEDKSDLRRLLAAAVEPDPQQRFELLDQVLDIDRFITFLAMETMTCHWDGYALNRNNYRLFNDMDSGRFVFMPHGMDQMFDWPPGRYPPDGSLYPRMKGDIARAVLTTSQGSRLYKERIATLRTNVFQEDVLSKRIADLSQRIRPTIAAYSPALADHHDRRVASLHDRVVRRARFIAYELENPATHTLFEGGEARFSNWQSQVTSPSPELQFTNVDQDGVSQLRIAMGHPGGAGSWRTRALLENGRYRFEGHARASGGGNLRACLRISGARSNPRPVGTAWSPLNFTFNVEDHLAEVVLVCEAQGSGGEVWFDAESLRLVRVGD
jgi:spore coat protein H